MTDKELLELAAKAAGIEVVTPTMLQYGKWNPLTDDGDALRLAVNLGMHIGLQAVEVWEDGEQKIHIFEDGADPYDATRRAIVRAAAEVGKGMLTHDEFVMMFHGRFEDEEVLKASSSLGKAMP